jgi:amino acid adenylation domain-containing protein
MAAFKVLLMRYSGGEDLSVGTVIANRTRKEVEGLIGFFVNTLVMRTSLGGNPSFRELIGREREAALGAYAHQEVPFEKLVEEINPDRDLSRSPLFQVMMTMQNTGREAAGIRGLQMSAIEAEAETAKFDLTLMLTESGEGITGWLEYSRDLYEAETIARMVSHYLKVLAEVVRDPQQRLRDIQLMTASERRQLVEEWNRTTREYGEPRWAHELIAERAARDGDAIAVKSEQRYLSYRSLEEWANRLAHYLIKRGVRLEEVVGISTDRSIEMVVALLGALKAGAAYLPIEGNNPAERASYMVEEAGVKVLLSQGRAGRVWEGRKVRAEVIDLEEKWCEIGEESEESPRVELGGGNLAYVIYTSGSTGRPKGVMINHGGLSNYLRWASEAYRIEEGEGAPVNSSIGFDLTVTSVYGPLVNGKRVELLSEEEWIDGLLREMRQGRGFSLLKITPAHMEMLENELGASGAEGGTKALVIGGEELKAGSLKYWRERAKGTRLINEYGPTETVVGCCVYEVEVEGRERERVPIGKPISNTRMYILDVEGEAVPIGVKGEIYIGGAGVGRGYVGRPELTAERFVPDGMEGREGEVVYRSGDVGRYVSDGNIEYLGRVDDQVKVRGYRIEAGEIERVMKECEGVKQSIVVSREEEGGRKSLVGYVVMEGECREEELKRYVRERLPEYMVPEVIEKIEEMPLTANGKVDRKRLPRVKRGARENGREKKVARTPVEEMLLSIFEEVLKVEAVGVEESFFELGGHSLLATQVMSRVRNRFGVEMGVRRLFEEATIEGLAKRIEEALGAGAKEEGPALVRVGREGGIPLSFAQQRLWFIDQLEPGNRVYNVPGAVRLEGQLKLKVLEEVINEIVRRHEVLRTRIEVVGGEPVQVIEEWQPRKLARTDLTHLTPNERDIEVHGIMQREAATGFDLSRGPLLRVKVLKLGRKDHVVLFTMHHIVSDGWSMGVLVKEVCELYQALSEGRNSPLPELEIQYADYAYWQRQYLTGAVLERHLDYWKRQFYGRLSVLNLPTDHTRPEVPSHRGAATSFSLPVELSESLRRLSKREGVTLFMTLLAAFKTLLYKYTEQEDIIVGVAVANRNQTRIEPLIGFFVNMLPLRTDFGGNPRFVELLGRVKEVALGGYAHQDVPFERLVEEIQPERSASGMPLFNVAFGIHNAPGEGLKLKGINIRPMTPEQEVATLDLTLWVTEGPGGMRFRWTYSRDLFEARTIKRMHNHFENLLFNIAARPDARLTALEVSPEAGSRPDSKQQRGRDSSAAHQLGSIKRRGIDLSKR